MGFTIGELLGDQALVFSDFPTEEVLIAGVAYNALVMDQTRGNDYGEGGRTDDAKIRLAIERSAITGAIPVRGTLATYDGVNYRIAEVEQDDAAASVIINLENQTL